MTRVVNARARNREVYCARPRSFLDVDVSCTHLQVETSERLVYRTYVVGAAVKRQVEK